jgi:hypothetical protein
MQWNDGQGHRDRRAWALILGPGDVARPFTGESIPGVCAAFVAGANKNGKWSSTTYQVELAEGVRLVSGHEGWDTGTFAEGLASATHREVHRWVDLANVLGVSLRAAQAFLRAWRPKAAEALDRIEADLEALDASAGPDGASVATVSFGSPVSRIRAAFWAAPVLAIKDGALVGRIRPGRPTWAEEGREVTLVWSNPQSEGAVRVLECVHSSGMHGGTYSLRCAVSEGTDLVHGFGHDLAEAELRP